MDELNEMREKVDSVDDQILQDLFERVRICRAIGELKKKKDKPVHDVNREVQVLNHVREKARTLQLDPERIERVYREIVNMCSNVQQ